MSSGPVGEAHALELENDPQGWDYATCICGWSSPPCPDMETAADFYGDHRAAVAVKVTAKVIGKATAQDHEGTVRPAEPQHFGEDAS